jgi:hypothetical protein
MTHSVLEVTNGPAKDDLLRAVANTDNQLTTVFDTTAGALEATINQLEEQGEDGVDFTLWGQLASSEVRGAYFTASYNCASRTGRLALKQATERFTTLKIVPPH